MKHGNQAIFARLKRVVDTILFLNKRKAFSFKGTSFYPSEVHLMLAVKDLNGTNVTRISEAMGVTKGAISQTASRLAAKEVLHKTKDPNQKNELTLHFTPFGQEVLAHYQRMHEAMQSAHEAILAAFSDREKAAIEQYLDGIEQLFSKAE